VTTLKASKHIATELKGITEHKDNTAIKFDKKLTEEQIKLRDENKIHIKREIEKIEKEGALPNLFTSQQISQLEVNAARSAQNTNKAPGADNVSNEMIKYGGKKMGDLLHAAYNMIWFSGIVPEEIQRAVLIVIHKKGAKTDIGNYRPITLASAILKTYEKVIGNRIMDFMRMPNDDGGTKIHNAQGMCKETQGSLDAVANLIQHISQMTKWTIVSYDLAKAFDRVPPAFAYSRIFAKTRIFDMSQNLL